MSINNFSLLARSVNHLNNPNKRLAVLAEEIPADFGRAYAGYKRGGILEGAEKFRKEVMSAIVWLFGIPVFKALGDAFCEKILNIPMAIDYSFKQDGADSIENSVKYLTGNLKNTNLDVSELKKYGNKFKGMNIQSLVGKVKHAKQATAILAWILNCVMMGIVLPKLNQHITNKKLQKENTKKQITNFDSMDEFINKTNKNKNTISFGGFALNIGSTADKFVYGIENINTVRLVSTDIPMIAGRAATSRNKYEALEFIIMDGGSIFFYNFCNPLIQKLLRKKTGIANIDPKMAEIIMQTNQEKLGEIIKNANNEECLKRMKNSSSDKTFLEELFGSKEIANQLYKEGTYGKYGKINAFIKNKDLKDIEDNIIEFLSKAKNTLKEDGKVDLEQFQKFANTTCKKNAAFLGAGLIGSIIGLSIIMPKLTFFITKKLTGRNEFTGLANYDNDKKDVKKC